MCACKSGLSGVRLLLPTAMIWQSLDMTPSCATMLIQRMYFRHKAQPNKLSFET